jgi:hypothetical protein
MIKRLQATTKESKKLPNKELDYCLNVLTTGKFYESELVVKDANGNLRIVSSKKEDVSLGAS